MGREMEELVSDWGFLDRPRMLLEDRNGFWLFFWMKDGSLGCTRSLNGGANWTAKEVLIKDFSGEFAASKTKDGHLVLAAGDQENNIHIWQWSGQAWHISLADRPSQEGPRQLCLEIDSEDKLHLFYIACEEDNPDQFNYYHMTRHGTEWTPPLLLAGAPGCGGSQPALCQNHGVLHLIYPYRGKSLELRHRFWQEGHWTDPRTLTTPGTDNVYPMLYSNPKGGLQLTWLSSDGRNTRVALREYREGPGWTSGGWQKEQYLSPVENNCYSPVLWGDEVRTYCLWQQLNGVFVAVQEGKNPWSQPYHSPWLTEFLKILGSKGDSFRPGLSHALVSYGRTGRQLMFFPDTLKALAIDPESYTNNQVLSFLGQVNEFANKEVWLHIDKKTYGFTTLSLFELLHKILFEIEDLKISIELLDQTRRRQEEVLARYRRESQQKDKFIRELQQKLQTREQVIHALQSSLTKVTDGDEYEDI